MIQQNGPAGRRSGAGECKSDLEADTTGGEPGRQFPRCPLHNVRLVDCLPRNCPLRADRPGDIIDKLRALAHDALQRGVPRGDVAEALHAFRMAEICETCIRRMLNRRAVRRLRAQSGVTSE